MNKKVRNIASVTTAALLATTAIGYSVLSNNEKTVSADNSEDKKTLENTISESVSFTTTGEDKEETVFVISDANGNVTKTIVSDWLKNKEGSETIEDKSDLTNIVNVKTDAAYEQDNNGNLVWDADGEDIYYQGETDKALPVDVKLTYYLDGKEMSASEIAGKSGKVTIRFDYTNHEKREVTVNGKKTQMYVPFTMISGMILNTEDFSNVEVSSGKVISDGNRYIVVGLAFPGLDADLDTEKLSDDFDLDVSFPDYVEVTADAKEFELGLTLTMGSADLISQVNADTADSLDDVEELIHSLVSATDELKNGTKQLKDGLLELKNNFVTYADGVKTLTSGVAEINDGVSQLDAKTPELTDGMKSVLDGVDEIIGKISGENGAANGADRLSAGATQVDDGVTTLKGKVGELIEAIAKLATGAKTVDDNLGTAIAAFADNSETEPGLTSGSKAVADGVAELQSQLIGMIQTINASIEDNNSKIAQCQAVLDGGISPQTRAALSEAEIAMYNAQIQQLTGANLALNQMLQGMNPESMSSSLNTLQQGAQSVADGVAQVEAGLKQLEAEGTSQVAGGLAQLNEQVPALSTGIDDLKAGTAQVAGGAAELATGIHTLEDALSGKLRPGVDTLYQGGLVFKSSIAKLYDGTKRAAAGGADLNSGTDKVTSGIGQLYDGSVKLDDGMAQYKEEAIDQVADFAENDLKEVIGRVNATVEAADEYTIFSDAAEGKSTSVKFVYETSAVVAE